MNEKASDLFTRALELPESEREAYLAQACGDDAELHLEVQRMLVDAARADSFFGDANCATLPFPPHPVPSHLPCPLRGQKGNARSMLAKAWPGNQFFNAA